MPSILPLRTKKCVQHGCLGKNAQAAKISVWLVTVPSYTLVYIFFFLPVGCISVAPVRTRLADVLRLSASPCESAQLDVACFYGVPSCRIPPAEEWERNFWRARRRL